MENVCSLEASAFLNFRKYFHHKQTMQSVFYILILKVFSAIRLSTDHSKRPFKILILKYF